ncbi:MAG: hypothetical protein H0X19_09115 [Rubrobacter sp.]|nr:hypothetical protein [Rubrobacter sp.]
MTSQQTSRRLTVQEAAEVLGTSVDAVRMRVRRGSLLSEKDPDGRVYVYLNDDSSKTRPRPDGEPTALISAKDETIAVLREQLEAERDAHREARRIIAGLVQRVPALDAPAEASAPYQPNETATEDAANVTPGTAPPADGSGAQNGSQRSWWRRVFGG